MSTRLPARPFTEAEDAAICLYAELGMTRAEIAERLYRNPDSVFRRIRRLLNMGRTVAASNPHASRIKGAAAQRARERAGADQDAALAGFTPALPKGAGVRYRNCLCCQQRFLSAGAHNRLCRFCRNKSTDRFSTPAAVMR